MAAPTPSSLTDSTPAASSGSLAYVAASAIRRTSTNRRPNGDLLPRICPSSDVPGPQRAPTPNGIVEGVRRILVDRQVRQGRRGLVSGCPPQAPRLRLVRGTEDAARDLAAGTEGRNDLRRRRRRFTARGWLLTHYLIIEPAGADSLPPISPRCRRGHRRSTPRARRSAISGQLDQESRRLSAKKPIAYLQHLAPPRFTVEPVDVTPLSAGAAQVILRSARRSRTASPEARPRRLPPKSAQIESRSPADELVETTLAEAELDAKHPAAAEAAADRALAANPRSIEAMVLKGQSIAARAGKPMARRAMPCSNKRASCSSAPTSSTPKTRNRCSNSITASPHEGVAPDANAVGGAPLCVGPCSAGPGRAHELGDGLPQSGPAEGGAGAPSRWSLTLRTPATSRKWRATMIAISTRAMPRPRSSEPSWSAAGGQLGTKRRAAGPTSAARPRRLRIASHSSHSPNAVAMTMAISDASRPKPPPVSSGRPASRASTRPWTVGARHRDVEDLALGEIPRGVEAHRQPQAARQHVGGAEHHARLERDPDGDDPGRVGVAEMRRAETAPRSAAARPSCRRTPRSSGTGCRGRTSPR